MGTTPTGRLTGKDAVLNVGPTAGTSSVYAGADLKNIRASFNGQLVDLSANSDDWTIEKNVRGQWEISAEKLINATPTFMTVVLAAVNAQEAVYCVFQSSGGTILTGLFNIVSYEINLPDAAAAMENITFRSTGAVTAS